ncbi:MAG TPA: M23 family metallopeptidase [Gaiellaceae bacterium]|nr:M23 family metallopeptidase [Gaiellaceae bacterium]
MRRGVWLFVLGVLAAAIGAASALADGTTGTTATTSTPAYARLTPSYLPAACVGAGEAAIVEPGSRVLALGTPASARGPSAYPATAPVVAFASATAGGSTCKTASVTLQSVSLFGGLVTATSLSATHGSGTVSGLAINGSPVTLAAGQTALLGDWGEVTSGRTVGRLTAPLAVVLFARHGSLPAGTTILLGFAASAQPVSKSKSTTHPSSTPPAKTPGSTTTTPVAAPKHSRPQNAAEANKHHHKKKRAPQPLTARPSLGYKPGHYVFPVNGGASYSDTYGGVRNDIYDGWHHGDDLFAQLGTPVLAVATGKLSLVGWNRLGGWRLWLTDGKGNSFYYAHLAGYSRWILDHPNVKAGQVIGFLGRTGDAFTTDPHLHFEIHPRLYLDLGYDGAVDPTTYLEKWHTVWVPRNEMPQPAKLTAPVGAPAQEAAVVWHELLAARHLLGTHKKARAPLVTPDEFPRRGIVEAAGPRRRITDIQATSAHAAATDVLPWLGGGSGGLAILALSAGGFFVRRRRRTSAEPAA